MRVRARISFKQNTRFSIYQLSLHLLAVRDQGKLYLVTTVEWIVYQSYGIKDNL